MFRAWAGSFFNRSVNDHPELTQFPRNYPNLSFDKFSTLYLSVAVDGGLTTVADLRGFYALEPGSGETSTDP